MPTAISYIRFSSQQQSSGDSTKRQSKLIAQWLKNNPEYHLDEQLCFQDLGISGYSGANATKGAFSEFLSAVEKGYIQEGSVLLVESLDRVSRQDIDIAGEQLRKILRAGVEVVTLTDNSWYTKASLKDSLSMIKALLVMERAHEESEIKSKRLRSVWAEKRLKAEQTGKIMSKRCVAWLRVSEDRSHFELIPEHVRAVRRIFQLRLEGMAHARIAKQMNIEGFSTVNQYKSVKGGFSQTSVTELLSNRSVIGYKIPSKSMAVKGVQEIPNYYPAIITEQEFYAVQQLKQGGTGRKPSSDKPLLTNLFKGIIRCSECHHVMILSGASAKRHGNYRCSMVKAGRCHTKGLSRLKTDTALIQGLLYNTNRLNLQSPTDTVTGHLQTELTELTKRKENLLKLAELSGDIESSAVRLKELNKQIASVQGEIANHHQRESSTHLETIQHLDMTVKKDRVEAQIIIKRVIKSIMLNTAKATCDITLHNGIKLNNYPLSHVIDGARFSDIVSLLEDKEFTFSDNETSIPAPIHTAPEWVQEAIAHEANRKPPEPL
ncbi:recombinase family protein [Mangrovibacter yixingensis]|uniref:recombinase family protein n=1 Tax=Mangrovibacter yixingensis TaxID=1529639 RepID=UPI001CFB0551|nr:recombinase family protein [Mangrovibacter yixingensis]